MKEFEKSNIGFVSSTKWIKRIRLMKFRLQYETACCGGRRRRFKEHEVGFSYQPRKKGESVSGKLESKSWKRNERRRKSFATSARMANLYDFQEHQFNV